MSDTYKTQERKLASKIGYLRQTVEKNAGELGLIARYFSKPGEVTGDFFGPEPYESNIIQLGVLTGESVMHKEGKSEALEPWSNSWSGSSYFFSKDLVIPCSRFLTQATGETMYDAYLGISDLEKISDGELSLDKLELLKLFGMYEPFSTELKNIDLIAGDENVYNFLKNNEVRDPEKFIRLIKDPVYTQGKIDTYHNQTMQKNAKNLVDAVNELRPDITTLFDKEERLMRISGDYWMEKDGAEFYWNQVDTKQLTIYKSLRSEILNKMKDIEFLMKKRLPDRISAQSPGFNEEVDSNQYLSIIRNEIIEKTKNSIDKIEDHFKEVKKEAHDRSYPNR